MEEKFKLGQDEVKNLIPPLGSCVVSNKITLDGLPVGFMYRDYPEENMDSGWRILSGTESEDYLDNPSNSGIFDLNTVANIDRAIIPYIEMKVGTQLERKAGSVEFVILEED